MSNAISRRSLLQAIPAVGAAVAVPTVALAVEPEHPWVKARRLAKELAETLSEIEPEDRSGQAIIWYDENRGYRYAFANR